MGKYLYITANPGVNIKEFVLRVQKLEASVQFKELEIIPFEDLQRLS